jgi:hypothetical protein
MTRFRRVFGAAIVAGVTAIGAMAVPAGAASAPSGYTTTRIPSVGVSIAVPDTWLQIDPKSQTAADALQKAADANPKLSGLMEEFQQLKGTIKFWVIDTGASEFATNMLVLPTPFPASVLTQPAKVKQSLASELGSSVQSLTVKKIRVDKTPALEADATLALQSVDGTPTTAYATIYLIKTKKGVVDFDYTGALPPTSDPTLRTMIKSIDIK